MYWGKKKKTVFGGLWQTENNYKLLQNLDPLDLELLVKKILLNLKVNEF
jgi:hypothetical protein